MFDKLLGNPNIKETLKRLTETERIPHSALFVGKNGIGKKLYALELAKYFACKNPSNFENCGECASCTRASIFNPPKFDDRDSHKKVIFSEHPDVGMVIPYRNNILVDSIRDLETQANFRPYEAKARCFIINDAEKLNAAASNALLKTLEEPPETTYIFLITSNPSALLPTILSRCQMFRFAPIRLKIIEEFLFEQKEHSSENAKFLSRASGGSLGEALEIDADWLMEQSKIMLHLLESFASGSDLLNVLQTAEDLNNPKTKEEYEANLRVLQIVINDIWLLRTGNDRDEIVNFPLEENLKRAAAEVDSETLSKWQSDVDSLREKLRFNLNKKIATDGLFMEMSG